MINPEAIDLTLPASTSAQQAKQKPVVIAILKNGEILFNGEAVLTEQIEARIVSAVEDGQKQITLKTDAKTPVQQMIEVMDAVRAGGASDIALATRQTK